jgi:hypothetical protein
MTKYDVTVSGYNCSYHESFVLFADCKLNAMKKGMELARKCDNVSGYLRATARVVREETFTPGICV